MNENILATAHILLTPSSLINMIAKYMFIDHSFLSTQLLKI